MRVMCLLGRHLWKEWRTVWVSDPDTGMNVANRVRTCKRCPANQSRPSRLKAMPLVKAKE